MVPLQAELCGSAEQHARSCPRRGTALLPHQPIIPGPAEPAPSITRVWHTVSSGRHTPLLCRALC